MDNHGATVGTIGKNSAKSSSELRLHLASGEAALTLLESLLLHFIDRGVLSAADIVEAVEHAIAAKRQMIADGEHTDVAAAAVGKLSVLSNSIAAAAQRERRRES